MGTTLEYQEVKVVPPLAADLIFDAECVKVEVVEKSNRDKTETYKKVQFKFVISDPGGDYDGHQLWGETSTNFNNHPDCRLSNWAKALLGVDFPVGFQLELDGLQGQHGKIVTGTREYEKNGESKVHTFVADVMPATGLANLAYDGEEPF